MRERERERERVVCVCEYVWERERGLMKVEKTKKERVWKRKRNGPHVLAFQLSFSSKPSATLELYSAHPLPCFVTPSLRHSKLTLKLGWRLQLTTETTTWSQLFHVAGSRIVIYHVISFSLQCCCCCRPASSTNTTTTSRSAGQWSDILLLYRNKSASL